MKSNGCFNLSCAHTVIFLTRRLCKINFTKIISCRLEVTFRNEVMKSPTTEERTLSPHRHANMSNKGVALVVTNFSVLHMKSVAYIIMFMSA